MTIIIPTLFILVIIMKRMMWGNNIRNTSNDKQEE